jgi:hypothetical protein
MNHETRLNPRQQEECVPITNTQPEGQVFPTPEDALRADRQSTPVPPDLTQRLANSLAQQQQPPPVSWWKRLLGLRP